MRRTIFAVLSVSALSVAGCGSTATFANKPRPPVPVDLSVYIDNARVSVSPASVGAGPVNFIVTNQASRNESLTIQPAGGGSNLASTGPINPQATAQVTVDFGSGDYTIASGSAGGSLATSRGPRPARLHIGPARPSANNVLLQP
ncbi:MAG: hypothetical protein ACYC91_15010 [Solirubrobacteraceae bacterium]